MCVLQGAGESPSPQPCPVEGEEAGAPRLLFGPMAARGYGVALGWGLGAYAAEFVVLARTLGVRLVTLDGGILEGGDVAAGLTGRGNSVGHGEYSAF